MTATTHRRVSIRDERGMALIVALMAVMLLTALGMALVLTTTTETSITGNYRDSAEALYAADAGIERVMQDLLFVPNWNDILRGQRQSPFIDGPPSGWRDLPGGGRLDLTVATNMLNCGKPTTCSTAEMDARTPERPWGPNNPQWQLFAYGPLENMIETGTIASPMYVVVWVADDPSETDNDPTTDGSTATNPGMGILSLRAEAYGALGARRIIEVTVARSDTTEIERGYTGQRGQDEQNRRARKAAVQTPGRALTRSSLGSSGFTVQ